MRNYLPRSLRNAARTIHSRQPGGMCSMTNAYPAGLLTASNMRNLEDIVSEIFNGAREA
jgi:hypothetical protein